LLDSPSPYKERADKRRSEESTAESGFVQEKVTEILIKDLNNYYTCANSNRRFKPQEITGHVKSCVKNWCKKHKIK
jgi:isochorismate hydrolase